MPALTERVQGPEGPQGRSGWAHYQTQKPFVFCALLPPLPPPPTPPVSPLSPCCFYYFCLFEWLLGLDVHHSRASGRAKKLEVWDWVGCLKSKGWDGRLLLPSLWLISTIRLRGRREIPLCLGLGFRVLGSVSAMSFLVCCTRWARGCCFRNLPQNSPT